MNEQFDLVGDLPPPRCAISHGAIPRVHLGRESRAGTAAERAAAQGAAGWRDQHDRQGARLQDGARRREEGSGQHAVVGRQPDDCAEPHRGLVQGAAQWRVRAA